MADSYACHLCPAQGLAKNKNDDLDVKTATSKCFLSVRQGSEEMTHAPHVRLTQLYQGPLACAHFTRKNAAAKS